MTFLRENNWVKAGIAGFLGGILLTPAFPPFDLFLLSWIALVPVFLFLRRMPQFNPVQILFLSFIFFIVTYDRMLAGILHNYSFWYLILLNLYLLFFYWCLFYGYALLSGKTQNPYFRIIFISFIFVILEYFKTLWISFPETVSVTQARNPIALIIFSYGGQYLVSFLILISNSLLTEFLINWKNRKAIRPLLKYLFVFPGLPAFLFLIFSLNPIPDGSFSGKKYVIHVLQGNISLDEYLMPPSHEAQIRQKYKNLFTGIREKSDLIIFPEEALSGIDHEGHEYVQWLRKESEIRDSDIILGVSTRSNEKMFRYNSMMFIADKGKKLLEYHKKNLLPLAESDFTAGEDSQPDFRSSKIWIAPNLCFDSLYPAPTMADVQKGARLIVVSANDAGFSDSQMAVLHMYFTVLRAAENGVFAVHASQAGPSAFISPKGTILASTGILETGILRFETGLISDSVSFYNRWGWIFADLVLFYILVHLFWIYFQKNLKKFFTGKI